MAPFGAATGYDDPRGRFHTGGSPPGLDAHVSPDVPATEADGSTATAQHTAWRCNGCLGAFLTGALGQTSSEDTLMRYNLPSRMTLRVRRAIEDWIPSYRAAATGLAELTRVGRQWRGEQCT